jgi:hypothetical protein
MPLRNASLCKPTEGRVTIQRGISLLGPSAKEVIGGLLSRGSCMGSSSICVVIEDMDRQHPGPQEFGAGSAGHSALEGLVICPSVWLLLQENSIAFLRASLAH